MRNKAVVFFSFLVNIYNYDIFNSLQMCLNGKSQFATFCIAFSLLFTPFLKGQIGGHKGDSYVIYN